MYLKRITTIAPSKLFQKSLPLGWLSLILFAALNLEVCSQELIQLKSPQDQMYTVNEPIYFESIVSKNGDASDFFLKKIEGQIQQNGIECTSSRIDVKSGLESPNQISYIFSYIFKAPQKGDYKIESFEFIFSNAAGNESRIKTPEVKFSVVSFWVKHQINLLVSFGLIVFAFILFFIFKRFQNKKNKKVYLETELEFKRLKIKMEGECLKKLKKINRFIISGHKEKYCPEVIELLKSYFAPLYPHQDSSKDPYSFLTSLKKLFTRELVQKINQFLSYHQQVQFGSNASEVFEMEKLKSLVKEIMSEHRLNISLGGRNEHK